MFDVCRRVFADFFRTVRVLGRADRHIRQALWLTVLLVAVLQSVTVLLAQESAPATSAAGSSTSKQQAQPAETTKTTDETSTGKTEQPLLIPTNATTVIEIMGIWMVPYVLASVLLVGFSLERLVVLRRGRVIPAKFVGQFIENLKAGKLDAATAISLCEKNGSPIAKLFITGLRKWGRPGIEVEQAIIDGGERQVSALRSHVRALNTISVIMPMVGLFGTVVGMVQSFNELATAAQTGNNAMLAAGISVALLTTAFGLAIAIPALTMFVFLTSRVESLVLTMDEIATEVAYFVSAEGIQARTEATSRSRAIPRQAAEKALPVES
jgi:biopolymer transport protein ExbB